MRLGLRTPQWLLVAACIGFWTAATRAAPAPDPATDRLVNVARLWVTVDYFHPYLANRPIEWEKALVDALPAIRSAKTRDEYIGALNALLGVLGDTATRAAAEGTLSNSGPGTPASGPTIQRFRFHHGLAPYDDAPASFYSGILTRKTTAPVFADLPMGDDVVAHLRLSESVDAASVASAAASQLATPDYPAESARVLGLVELWGAVRYFFAYKDLMDEEWDGLFRDYLLKCVGAKDALAYHLAMAELVSHLSDSNATASSPVLAAYFGVAAPDIDIRLIEKKPVVIRVAKDALAAGAHPGDIVTQVDGENAGERIRREANFLSASNAGSLSAAVAQRLLHGDAGSTATLQMMARDGSKHTVRLERRRLSHQSDADALRVLNGGIGYLDVTRLNPNAMPGLWEKIRSSKALIFDLRGDCPLESLQLAAHVGQNGGKPAFVVTGPLAEQPDVPRPGTETATASYFSIETVPQTVGQPFLGPVAILVDERTRGVAERAALLLTAAGKAKSLGTPSSGAPAEVTRIRIAGNLIVSFSGQDLRLLNGGQIQRSGIAPATTVATTIADIAAQRDPVLQQALAALGETLSAVVK